MLPDDDMGEGPPVSELGVWRTLTRQRRHRLVDLLLGALAVATLAGGIASVSPVLSIGLVAVLVGGYFVGLSRGNRSKAGQRPDPPPALAPGDTAIDELENVLSHAQSIPLTDQVRVDRDAVRPLAEAIRSQAVASGSAEAVEASQALVRQVADARPIPFTRHVRVDLRAAKGSIETLHRLSR